MEGILLVDKPEGWTSFDVVNYVRKIVANYEGKKPRSVKVGHTGTLDPAATGLLVLCIGKNYTKRVPTLIKHDKTYEAEITLGSHSTTGDKDGEITKKDNQIIPEIDTVNTALMNFTGTQKQTPPAFSAIKVNGKRAYDLARKGETVELQQRDITVHDLQLLSYDWPLLKLSCDVSSGTYIRVLAEDIAKTLGTVGYLSALRRTVVDTWSVEQALQIDSLTPQLIRDNLLE